MDQLVSTEWLAGEMGASDLRVVDATYFLPDAGRNPRAEYEGGHIPGAVSFTGAKALAKQLSKTSKDTLVVAYCSGPSCNAYKRGASAAADLGFKNVKHLSAGISGWIKNGKKLEKN